MTTPVFTEMSYQEAWKTKDGMLNLVFWHPKNKLNRVVWKIHPKELEVRVKHLLELGLPE